MTTTERSGGEPGGEARRGRAGQPDERSAAEWTTFAISVVVIAGLVGVALYEHFDRGEQRGAVVRVEVAADRADRREELYYVPFRVTNVGNDAATDVAIRFQVLRGEETVEEATTVLPLLPVNGESDGEFVTSHDPAGHRIVARVDTLWKP